MKCRLALLVSKTEYRGQSNLLQNLGGHCALGMYFKILDKAQDIQADSNTITKFVDFIFIRVTVLLKFAQQ